MQRSGAPDTVIVTVILALTLKSGAALTVASLLRVNARITVKFTRVHTTGVRPN